MRHLQTRRGRRGKRAGGTPGELRWAFRTWLTWAEAFGLGELQLAPGAFWALTPHEFALARDGFYRREDRAWEKIATLGIWVLSPWSKERFTPASLLGRATLTTLPPEPFEVEPDEAALEAEKAAVLARALAWARR